MPNVHDAGQNGRILTVQLIPHDASYTGEYDVFLKGGPLNVCDMEFGADGALYFIKGGRASQTGLYRVTYVDDSQDSSPLHKPVENPLFPAADRARRSRRQLEKYHMVRDPGAVDFTWPHLRNDDCWIRFAARVAIERQDVNGWRQRAVNEKDVTGQLSALLALARVSPADAQSDLLAALERQGAPDKTTTAWPCD